MAHRGDNENEYEYLRSYSHGAIKVMEILIHRTMMTYQLSMLLTLGAAGSVTIKTRLNKEEQAEEVERLLNDMAVRASTKSSAMVESAKSAKMAVVRVGVEIAFTVDKSEQTNAGRPGAPPFHVVREIEVMS